MPRPSTAPRPPELRVLWLIITGVWAASGLVLYFVDNRGTFGDMFGAVNALFSGLAFATLIYTSWMQREELGLQREELAATRAELEGQKLQLAEQSATFALQRFEDSLFALLRTQGEIVAAMDLVNELGKVTRSRDCFAVWYRRLRKRYIEEGSGNSLGALQATYRKFYVEHQAELGHCFRHLYHIIKFIKEAPIAHRKRYTSLVRAQLSGYEHLMLFYNCLSEYGHAKFKPLVEEFALLENMPRAELLSESSHVPLYEKSAFGEDGAA